MDDMAGPRARKASLFGANIVTLGLVKVGRVLDAYKEPSKEVRLKDSVVLEMEEGGIRRESIIWTTPPVNARSCMN